ncbi:MAG: TIGR03936 family radical SAM-associated protein, partial [Candidatus Geothermincolales bacterium]
EGDAVFLSHRETMRALERALRRSGLPLCYSEGFNPRPKVSFSPALPLGVSALAEYLEVKVDGQGDLEMARERMNQALPRGLAVREIKPMPLHIPKLSRWARYGLYRVEKDQRGEKEVSHLVLSLAGEEQGRLREALEQLGIEELGGGEARVTRTGIYASLYEAVEDAGGKALYYDGKEKVLRELEGDEL